MPLMVSSPRTVAVPSSARSRSVERKTTSGWRSASKNSGLRTCARKSAGETIEIDSTLARPSRAPSVSVASTSEKEPRKVETPMCLTAKPNDEWTGSDFQVPASGCVAVVMARASSGVDSDYSPVIDHHYSGPQSGFKGSGVAPPERLGQRCVAGGATPDPLQILGQRDLLRRLAVGCLPGLVGDAVAARVLAGAAPREPPAQLAAAVHQPPPHAGGDARELAAAQLALGALDRQREDALEDEVDLLLLAVAVDTPLLARPQQHEVDAERRHAELS